MVFAIVTDQGERVIWLTTREAGAAALDGVRPENRRLAFGDRRDLSQCSKTPCVF